MMEISGDASKQLNTSWLSGCAPWKTLLLSTCLCSGEMVHAEERQSWVLEKAPYHWPNNLNARSGEPGCWKPPSDRFSQKEALRAVVSAFSAGLNPADRGFGDIPADLHVDGFVPVRLRLTRSDGSSLAKTPCEVSIVRLGPRKEKMDDISEHAIKTFLLLTSLGRTLCKKEIADTPSGGFASHYLLSRVFTQFGANPMVLLFCNSGANFRTYSYELYTVTPSGLEQVWIADFYDGNGGSLQQPFWQSNFDFCPLRSGRANEFTVYTTSGCRRWMEPGDGKDLKPTYTKRIYQWDPDLETFVKIRERSFSKP